jgi:hypothetical protein
LEDAVKYIDILGQTIEQGDRVAFAQTRGGTLALGHVVATRQYGTTHPEGLTSRHQWHEVQVRLESNGRDTWLPYRAEKYVVVQKGPSPESQVPLSTRALQSVQRLCNGSGLYSADIGNVRADLNLPWSESHTVHAALESLVESGELVRLAYPPYSYILAGE